MIPDTHIVEKCIEFAAGSTASMLGMKAATPIFRAFGGFVWERAMERASDRAYEYAKGKTGHLVKNKIGLRIENHSNYLSIKLKEKEFAIHHPTRDRTHERFTLLTHYMHPERFSPLLQERIQTRMATVLVVQENPVSAEAPATKISEKRTVIARPPISIYD